MKILRWLLMLPAGFVAAVVLSLMVGIFTKPLGVDTFYATTFCSYFAIVAVAAYVAPKHRLGAIIAATFAALVLLVAVVANNSGMGTMRQRSHNPVARLVLGLLGVAGGGIWVLRTLKDDSDQ